jgi:hypothetical protein
VRPFPPPELTWQPGESFLHVYALPDVSTCPELAGLISRARAVAEAQGGFLVPVPDQWLHATVQMITVPAASIGPPVLAALRDALGAELAGLSPIELAVGPALCGNGGVVLDITGNRVGGPSDGPWQRLRGRVEAAIMRVVGEGALGYEPGPPHISVAYAAAEADSGPIQASLQQIRPGRATWQVTGVELVDVCQDAAGHRYTWRDVARIKLGGRPEAGATLFGSRH